MSEITIRPYTKEDIPAIFSLIKELAIYEKAGDEVETSIEQLEKDGLEDNLFQCFVAELDEKVVGFALYYFGYSTWKGKTLYLEDFVVKETHRGDGIGAMLFERLIQEANHQKAHRMDWQVLEWNAPAINFYKKYNAHLDPEWINGRFYNIDLENFSTSNT